MPEPVVVQPVVNAPPAAAPTPAAQPPSAPTDITGVMTPPAGGIQDQPPADPNAAPPTPEAIPYGRFQEVVTEKNKLAEDVRNLQAQVQVMEQFARTGVQPAAQSPQNAPTPEPTVEDLLKQFGDDDPYLNKAQIKQIVEVMDRRQQAISAQLEEARFLAAHPDFHQVTANTSDSPLVRALNADPELVQFIRSSPNPALAAYQIGKMVSKLGSTAPAPTPPVPPPPPIVPAPPVPTLGVLGGRGALGGKPNINTMTDAEFAEYQRQHAVGRIVV